MIISNKKHPNHNIGKLPDQKISTVGDGIVGNIDTVEVMKKMAREYSRHPLVKRYATNIIDYCKVPSHHYLEEARCIARWVQTHVRYLKDPVGTESLTAPDMMIRMLTEQGYTMGDCDDMSLLIASMLYAVGIRCKFRCVRYQAKSGPFNHIYVVVYENNIVDSMQPGPVKRLVLDAIIKDRPIGFEIPHASGQEFDV